MTLTKEEIDLSTMSGRLQAVIWTVNLYRLFKLMSKCLPEFQERKPLWVSFKHADTTVTFQPSGAEKRIHNFRQHESVRWTADLCPYSPLCPVLMTYGV